MMYGELVFVGLMTLVAGALPACAAASLYAFLVHPFKPRWLSYLVGVFMALVFAGVAFLVALPLYIGGWRAAWSILTGEHKAALIAHICKQAIEAHLDVHG